MLTRARSTLGVGLIAIASVASLSALNAPQVAAQPSVDEHPTSTVSEFNALHARVAGHVNVPLAAQLSRGLGAPGPGDLLSAFGTIATFTSRCLAGTKSFPTCLVYGTSDQLAQIGSQLKDIQNSINALSQQSKAQYQALAAAIAAVDARVAADVERNSWDQVKDAVGRAQLGAGMYANYAACMAAVVANSNGAHNATCAKPTDAGVFPGSTIPADANAPNILLQQFIAQQDQQGCDANYAQFQQDLVGTSTDPYTLTHQSGYSGPLFQYLLAGERASLGMGAGTTFTVFRPSLINKVGAAAATVRHNLDAYAATCASWADAKNPGSGQQYRDAALNGFTNGDGSTVLSMPKVLDTYAFPGWSESNPIGDGEALIAGDAMKAAMPWVTASLIKLAPSAQYGIHADSAATPAWNGLSATPMGSAYIPAFGRDLGTSGTSWSILTKADFRANLGDGGSPVALFRSAEGPNGTNPDNPAGRIWAAPEDLTLTNFNTSWFACVSKVCDYYFWNARTGVPNYGGDWTTGSQNVRIYTNMPMQGTVGKHSLMVNVYDHELLAQPAGPAIQMCAAGGTACSFQDSGWGASYGMPYVDRYLTSGWQGDLRPGPPYAPHDSNFGSLAFDRVPIGLGESWIVSDMDNGQPYNTATIPPALNLKAAPYLAGGPLQLPSNQN